ncbi:MAG: methionyl-tRNA formyltransferase [Nitrospirae bacterium]|nr:methionyl-tRNA formyltransferase [Nitrospirota bacterium]
MRVIFFGTPDFAVPSLRALLDAGEEVLLAVTQPDKVKGRGHALSMPPVKEFAASKGIPVIQPRGVRSADFIEQLKALAPDVIAVVAFGKIIPSQVLNLPPLGCINVHASLLPKYRGAAPMQWAVINGDKKTGITTMLMDEGLDTGAMLLQEETEITEEDNAYTLGRRLSETGATLLVKTLQGVRAHSIQPVPQSGEPTYAPPLKKEDGRIDWSFPAEGISNLIRGTFPWPGAYCFLNREKISIIRARVFDREYGCRSGRIEKIMNEEIHVCTGRGLLSVSEVRPEGKKTMSAAAFLRGRRLKEGVSFDL